MAARRPVAAPPRAGRPPAVPRKSKEKVKATSRRDPTKVLGGRKKTGAVKADSYSYHR